MDKASKKITKDTKRQERGKKSHETYMKRLKEKILEDNQILHLLHLTLQLTLRLLRLPLQVTLHLLHLLYR